VNQPRKTSKSIFQGLVLLSLASCAPRAFDLPWVGAGATTATHNISAVGDNPTLGIVDFKLQHFRFVEFLTVGASFLSDGEETRICEGYTSFDLGCFFWALADPPWRKGPWWVVVEPGLGLWAADTNEHAGVLLRTSLGLGRECRNKTTDLRYMIAVAWTRHRFYKFRGGQDARAEAVTLAFSWPF